MGAVRKDPRMDARAARALALGDADGVVVDVEAGSGPGREEEGDVAGVVDVEAVLEE